MKPVCAGIAILLLISTGCSAANPPRFRPEASEVGYTVLYGTHGMWPHTGDGPCAELVPTPVVRLYEQGHNGALECPDHGGLDAQLTDLGLNTIAIWGIMFDGITNVAVAGVIAATEGHTYLAVLRRPADTYTVIGRDSSGRAVASLTSTELPPTLPVPPGPPSPSSGQRTT